MNKTGRPRHEDSIVFQEGAARRSRANGIAGEWGHNALPWPDDDERPGPACYCGKTGCIETFLSGPGMTADHDRRTGRREPPREIASAAERGDRAAISTMERYERRMARALASVINVLDPDVIVLGGGMSNIDRLYDHVPRLWSQWVFAATGSAPDVRTRMTLHVGKELQSQALGVELVRQRRAPLGIWVQQGTYWDAKARAFAGTDVEPEKQRVQKAIFGRALELEKGRNSGSGS